MSTKFDEDAHSSLVTVGFQRSQRGTQTNGHTEPQQRYYIYYIICGLQVIK